MFSPELGDWSWWISTAGGLYRLVKHDRKRPCFALWKSAERARLRKADWIFSPSVSSRMISKLGSMPPILVHWGYDWAKPLRLHWEWGLRLFLTEKDLFFPHGTCDAFVDTFPQNARFFTGFNLWKSYWDSFPPQRSCWQMLTSFITMMGTLMKIWTFRLFLSFFVSRWGQQISQNPISQLQGVIHNL